MRLLRRRPLRGKHCAASARSQTLLDSLSERVDEALVPAVFYLDTRDLESACNVQKQPGERVGGPLRSFPDTLMGLCLFCCAHGNDKMI
jgi:hypothetical protein